MLDVGEPFLWWELAKLRHTEGKPIRIERTVACRYSLKRTAREQSDSRRTSPYDEPGDAIPGRRERQLPDGGDLVVR